MQLQAYRITTRQRERFLQRLQRDELTGCLLWTGPPTPAGYGQLGAGGLVTYAHRVAWLLGHGAAVVPEGLHVRHLCHTPLCCEPAHLAIGTAQDNADDSAGRRKLARQLVTA